jgi:mRNA interferase HigB
MRVITPGRLRKFWAANPDSERPLRAWLKVTRKATWTNFGDIRRDVSGSADQFKRCTIFNIGGNKYRLVVRIHFNRFKLYVIGIYSHEDYDEGDWKDRC